MAAAAPPAMELVAVAKSGVLVYSVATEGEGAGLLGEPVQSFPAVPTADGAAWSSDGNLLGIFDKETGGVRVLSATDGYAELCKVRPLIGAVRSFYFSPLGSFLVTHENYQKDAGANVGVWEAKTGEPKFSFVLKRVTEMSWPPLKWTALETHCCRMVQDGVQVLAGSLEKLEASEDERKLTAPGIMAFEVAPRGAGTGPPHVAIVIAESKGAPAKCQIYRFDDLSKPTAVKNFFKAQTVQLWWNQLGTALLCKTAQEVDDTGKSYYGGSHLYFLHADGEESCIVAMPDEGAIHDVCWSPTADEFFLLHGDLPCNMTLHEGRKGTKRMEFGRGHRNTIRWNPFGRFLVCGGYGQLLGDTDFWDKSSKGSLGTARLDTCVMSGWAPNGRQYMAATTAPRMRMDNKIVLYDYCGVRLSDVSFDELMNATWRPRPRGAFPDRPASPGREPGAKAKAKAGGYPGSSAAAAKPQAYRPPGARGSTGLAEQLRKELGSTSAQSSSTASRVGPGYHPLPPGCAPLDAAGPGGSGAGASRNARRKKAKEAGGADNDSDGAEPAAPAPAKVAAKASAPEPAAPKAAVPAAAAGASAAAGSDNPEVEKKVRALRKKLRDIVKLKETEPAKLDPLQREKIAAEGDLIRQLAELGAEP